MWKKIKPYIGVLELISVYLFWIGAIAFGIWFWYRLFAWIF